MRIELETVPEELRSTHPVRCAICDGCFFFGPAIANAYDDDGISRGEVCPTCLAGGPEGIVERLRSRAWWYAKIAEDLEEAADEGVESVPTLEELRLMSLLA